MMDSQKGSFVFECDDCGEVLTTNTGNFEAARNQLTRARWKPRKVGADWKHFCPRCQ
jgi:hypothetical protein